MQNQIHAKYRAGDQVRVRVDNPPGHYRTPMYVQGKVGTIQNIYGAFRNPELLALGKDGFPKKVLYSVAFPQKELWENYRGPKVDTLRLDLYEHWLNPV